MPPKISAKAKLEALVKAHRRNILSTDHRASFCKVCEEEIIADTEFQVAQHLNGEELRLNLNSNGQSRSSSVVQLASFLDATGKQSQFSLDLCGAFLADDIPLHKPENPTSKGFFQK